MAVIFSNELRTILRGLMHMLNLRRDRGDTVLTKYTEIRFGRPNVQAARSAIVADSFVGDVVDAVIVHVVHDVDVYVVHRAVVDE